MATKTLVEGNRVTIGDNAYVVKPAGTAQYAVSDEFGTSLGYFTVRGKTVTPEDYGVPGADPVVQIGRLWIAANLAANPERKAGPASQGVCRIAAHEAVADADLDRARAHRSWMRKQPGCKASYFVHDPATGKARSISIWETREQLAAAREATPPEGAAPLRSASVEVFPFVEEP
jgi:hypothetical protein